MERYSTSTILKTSEGKQYYKSKVYPNIPLSENDIYVITTIGDRLDSLAYSYYNNATLWWVISMANNNITNGSLFPQPGTQLRIPTDIGNVLALYDKFNELK